MYPQCLQHTQLSPESVLYSYVDSSLCLSTIGLLDVLSSAWSNQCCRHKIWIYNFGRCRQLVKSNCMSASICLYIPSTLVLLMQCVYTKFIVLLQRQLDYSFTVYSYQMIMNIWRYNRSSQIYYRLRLCSVLQFVLVLGSIIKVTLCNVWIIMETSHL